MVYSSKFVACILLGGKPTKELANGVVPIPFGSEYSLRFRNKNDRRALVKFTIDGENVSGGGYVIGANSAIDIHRHHSKDARFRFVGLDSPEAVDFGKNGPNLDGSKGVVEAKFYLERARPVQPVQHHHHHWYNPWSWGSKDVWPTLNNPYQPKHKEYYGAGVTQPDSIPDIRGNPQPPGTIRLKDTNDFIDLSSTTHSSDQPMNMSYNASSPPAGAFPGSINIDASKLDKLNELKLQVLAQNPAILGVPAPPTLQDGVTVEGSNSGQSFYTVHFDAESDFVAVRLVLRGFQGEAPVMTTDDTYCVNCGANRRGRKSDKFCGVCGHKH